MTSLRSPFGLWRAAHRRRLTVADPQSGFAMFVALLLILIIAGLSVLVAGLVISENKPVQTARKEVSAVNASEAGFEIALTQLRAATDVYGNGDITQLPCSTSAAPGTPITGSVGPNAGAAQAASLSYRVYVRYYLIDPSTMGQSDLNQGTNLITCAGGQPSQVPKYAYLTSNGVGTTGTNITAANNRLLHTTYQFKTSTVNIAGGRLNMNGTSFCLDASTAPAVGTFPTITTCQNRGSLPAQSSWAYRSDLTLYLTTSGTPGLCLTSGSSFDNTATGRLSLQTCASQDGSGISGSTYPYAPAPSLQQAQEWNFDDSGRFEGASSTPPNTSCTNAGTCAGDKNGYCISASPSGNPPTGGVLYEQPCTGDTQMIWNPDFQVGAGPAGDNTNQLVNYYEFGRCLDVTHASLGDGQNINVGEIDYPCKQAPDPAKILWNEKWSYNATTGQLVTSPPGNPTYCLDAPDPTKTPANIVLIAQCNTTDASQKWNKKGDVVGDYGASYTIVSYAGLCLSIGAPRLTNYDAQWSSIITETCDGSLKQKWNAPANFVNSRLGGTGEDQGGQP
jgi:hypothetical protein